MNFRKSSKRPLTPRPPLIFGNLCCNFFLKFMTEVSSIMAKICNINFWIENDPPPLWNFSENSSVLEGVGFPHLNTNLFNSKLKAGLSYLSTFYKFIFLYVRGYLDFHMEKLPVLVHFVSSLCQSPLIQLAWNWEVVRPIWEIKVNPRQYWS